jgi:hypothetical protein
MAGKPFTALHRQSLIQAQLFDFTLTPPLQRAEVVLYVNSRNFYDLMPKHVSNSRYTKQRQGGETYWTRDKARYDFSLYGGDYTNIITPARISRTEKNGSSVRVFDIDMFPGRREWAIEWAVRIAAKRGAGTMLLDSHAGAEFTLYQLQRILEEIGHEMSYAQIREGLEVAMKCNIQTLSQSGDTRFKASSAIFPLGAIRERLHSAKAAHTYVAYHPFVTAGIKDLEFRQIDILKVAAYPGAIDRWIYLRLMHDYRYADGVPGGQCFNLKASTILACSGAGPFRRTREGLAAVRKALRRLAEGGDIEPNPAERHHLGPKGAVIDVTFDLRGSRPFARAMKEANGAAKLVAARFAARALQIHKAA